MSINFKRNDPSITTETTGRRGDGEAEEPESALREHTRPERTPRGGLRDCRGHEHAGGIARLNGVETASQMVHGEDGRVEQ